MTVAARISQADMPFSVRSLAERWSCSEGMIRKMIKDGTLQCFTIGTLIRIPVAEVERIECNPPQNTPSKGSGEGSPLSGETKKASGTGPVSPPPIGSMPKRKPGNAGGATVHHGPWSA